MKELLVPAGNMESLIIAIHSGADAIYLGGKKFGARAYANNFDNEEMIKAIKLCHLYNVRIYVTVNTLIKENELSSVMEYIEFLYINGVDAIIMQDIGLIYLARKKYPNLEIHASTQVHNSNENVLKNLYELGVKRVVLARELSLDDIKKIKTPLEKEIFIHGALCISYSGQCLFSSMILNRSGNRGMCAQMCRLPYKLMENDKIINVDGEYLLSPKELNTCYNFKDIMASDIVSLKIEGRMKSPEYVGCVTRLYRDLIDKYNAGLELTVDEDILNDLKVIFNRDYTNGNLFQSSYKNLMNIKSSNHQGIKLGEIIKIDKKYIYVKLLTDLNQGDGIRFDKGEGMNANFIYNEKYLLINKGLKGNIILLDNKFNIKDGKYIYKTLDTEIIKKYTNITEKKIKISMFFEATKDNKIKLTVTDGENIVTDYGNIPESAKSISIDEETINKQLSKLGNTPFIIDNIKIDVDKNLFINIKELNELRRKTITKFIEKRENKKVEPIINEIKEDKISYKKENVGISILVRNEEQFKAALESNLKRIYITDYNLYKKYQDKDNVYYRSIRAGNNIRKSNNYLLTELGILNKSKKGIGDYYLNVFNHATINYLSKYTDTLTLSVELLYNDIKNIMDYYQKNINVEIIIYGTIELMLMKYCPIGMLINKDKFCHACKDNKYYLIDRNNKKYPILTDNDVHLTHIMNYKPINKIEEIPQYKDIGINNFRIELLDEDYIKTKQIIDMVKKEVE